MNYDKSEICGIGSKKGAIGAFSQFRIVNLINDSVKILGCHHSYSSQLANNRNFCDTIKKISSVLNLWQTRDLSLLGRVQIFKTIGFSKILYLASMANVPPRIVEELSSIQNKFIWKSKTPKIRHSTLVADYQDGSIKNVNVAAKLKALKLTWVRKLQGDNCHPWKVIPSKILTLPNGDSVFHRNFRISQSLLTTILLLPVFYRELLELWEEFSYSETENANIILSESLWYNAHIQINNDAVFFNEFASICVNKVSDLFDENGQLIMFQNLTNSGTSATLYFKWMQIVDAFPSKWRTIIRNSRPSNLSREMLSKHCLYTESNLKLSVLHLSCRAIYNKLLEKTVAIPTSVQYWEDKIVDSDHEEIEWSTVYLLPRFATIDSYTRAFQYKIINNALFLNKKLSAMGVTESPECSLCKQEAETAIHLFCQCPVTSELWEKLQGCLSPNITLPRLTVKNALLGYMPTAAENESILNLINHIILIFKRSIFEMRYK